MITFNCTTICGTFLNSPKFADLKSIFKNNLIIEKENYKQVSISPTSSKWKNCSMQQGLFTMTASLDRSAAIFTDLSKANDCFLLKLSSNQMHVEFTYLYKILFK